MNTLTRSLLGGAALGALMAAPAASQQNYQLPLSITAMHAGRAVNKTNRPHKNYHCQSQSCTATVFTTIAASAYGKKVELLNTFYKFNNSFDLCTNPGQRIKSWKKTKYATINAGSTTFYEGCPGQQPTFYGDYYTLTDQKGFGKTDRFESMLTAHFHNDGFKYKGRLILSVFVQIGADQPAENSN